MIAFLKGNLEYKGKDYIIIDVNNIGYKVSIPSSVLEKLPELGSEVKIHTHLIVREDAQLLYGFITQEEHSLFELLLTVPDVGPSKAINILSNIGVEQLISAIAQENILLLTSISGIGKKTAQRLIIELKDKISNISEAKESTLVSKEIRQDILNDAMSALNSLGYKEFLIRKAIVSASYEISKDTSLEELVKILLRHLSI